MEHAIRIAWKHLKVILLTLLGLFLVVLFIMFNSKESIQTSSTNLPVYSSQPFNYATSSATVRGYTLEMISGGYSDTPNFIVSVRVLRGEKVLFKINQQVAGMAPFGEVKRVGDWPETEILHTAQDLATHSIIDVDGDGVPELAFIESDGGNGGGSHYSAHVIRLSDPVSILWEQEPNQGMSTFVDLGKGALAIATTDTTFSYWETDGASSPAEIVMLSLKNGKYVPDTALMRKVPPNDKELELEATRWKNVDWGTATGAICTDHSCIVPWAYALKLIYSGNVESAKKYIDLAYHSESRSSFDSKEDFLKKFTEQIMKSPYYEDLAGYFNLKAFQLTNIAPTISAVECAKDRMEELKNMPILASFGQYPVNEVYVGTVAPLDLNSSFIATRFKAKIEDAMKGGVNFAGHYVIATWGFTGVGNMLAVIDVKNGKAYPFPYVAQTGFSFKKDSMLLIVDPLESLKESAPTCYYDQANARPYYFVWKDNKFTLIGPTDNPPPNSDDNGWMEP